MQPAESSWSASKESTELPRSSSTSHSSVGAVFDAQRQSFLDHNVFKKVRNHIPSRFLSNRRLAIALGGAVFVIILMIAASTGSQPAIVLDVNAAANRTLGFGSIQMINLPIRQDKADAAAVQAFLSGLNINVVEGVNGSRLGEVGMPPSSVPDTEPGLSGGEKGCWRSHANAWSSMLRANAETVLIMEDDVTWDVNVKEVMRLAASHLPALLNGTGVFGINPTRSSHEQARIDPWHSSQWDLITFGHCGDGDGWKSERVKYDDPYTNGEKSEYFGIGLKGGRRMIRRAGGLTCTGAYAVSARGAAKLLLRSGFDLNLPVDVIMNDMIRNGQLRAYSIWPPPVVQWRYRDKLGMWGSMGSDIRVEHKDQDRSGWEEAHKQHDVWQLKGDTKGLREPAIKSAWGILIGHDDE
ncbi:glycosyltransferase family 25 [Colletotrichum higginsianum]|uniref:Glycosyltransferase family 25 n=2 Tax=Colletotrichum higginsianum TaxID=80884 RepID=H1VMG8_COLHI|nr:Glycosyltransferase family 25 [Colletotrichum higginsianum IMI 349063]OBR16590.1 Glycosyltransferase family 25 [Colletotrichum higginsianum IMI 349063]TID03678.1 Procollagen galactosyltransferase 1-B [Colletotrichum higginsianum]GJC91182.1 glycosyltransferase family 25 [Colletotrichum higginsianum]CCF41422.1 glycosyltransferase family 25 [Colletotrichum higginsianum]